MTNFIVDVEAAGRTPVTGYMTEFGIVEVETGDGFYAHLYETYPIPAGEPFIPQVVMNDDHNPISNIYVTTSDTEGNETTTHLDTFEDVVNMLLNWVAKYGDHAIAISDNNGFDMMWLNCFLDEHSTYSKGLVFGHSSRRIGDFYAGTTKKWKNSSRWKKWRKTVHDHNPVNDARGNREALLKVWETIEE